MERHEAQQARSVALGHQPGAASIAYESPEAVLADDTLTPEQKRRFLRDWLAELKAHVTGSEQAPDDAKGEGELVAQIRRWLAVLSPAPGMRES